MKTLRTILCWAMLLLTVQTVHGQQYNFISYSVEQGLAQTQVRALFQDSRGYLWIGTLGGVSRFDGVEFENFSKDDGLLGNQINDIFEDSRGRLWLASLGGITRFTGTGFESFVLPDTLATRHVRDLAEDGNGRLWLAIDNAGVASFDGHDFVTYTKENGLPHMRVRSVARGPEGRVWAGTRSGIAYFEKDRFVRLTEGPLDSVNVGDLLFDSKDQLWIASFGSGVICRGPKSVRQYTREDGLIRNVVRSVTEDRYGQMWFATKSGASRFDGTTWTNFSATDGMTQENLRRIISDREGNLWMGTDGGGVLKYNGETFVGYTEKEGLTNNFIMSIVEDAESNFWFSTYGAGVCRVVDGRIDTFQVEDGLSNNTVWVIYRDRNDGLWMGTSRGVSHFVDGAFERNPLGNDLNERRITAIFEDRKGRMWFGGKDGLFIYDNGELSPYVDPGGLDLTVIRSIQMDGKGDIWMTSASGIYRYNGQKMEHFDTENGLSGNSVVCQVEDFRQNRWFGTDNGLTYYDGQKFESVKIGKGHGTNTVNFLIFDDDRRLWIGTNAGIFELDVPDFYLTGEKKLRHFTTADGVRSMETNQNAAYKDRFGKLWFGTIGGAVRYDPDKRHQLKDDTPPLTHLTGMRLLLETPDWSPFADSLDIRTGLPIDLVLPYHKNHITFDYIGISHRDPEKVAYQYKLDGFDEDWLPANEATFATYSNLPDGAYTFRVRSSATPDAWSDDTTAYSFTITPPFWKTWWFFILCGAFLVGLGFLGWKWQDRIRKRKAETQQLVYLSKMLKLEQQTLNASMNRHFIFNALNSIQYYINSQDRLSANLYLSNFAELIRKNLDSSQTNTVALSEELERLRLYLTLEQMRFTDKFEYAIDLDREIDSDRVKIPAMLLQPYVENSIWHGILPMKTPGKISIGIHRYNHDGISFTIEDNGIGINTSRRQKKDFDKGHISKGMEITRGRVNLLQKMTSKDIFVKGPEEMVNDQGEPLGTKVEIVLPIDDEYYNN